MKEKKVSRHTVYSDWNTQQSETAVLPEMVCGAHVIPADMLTLNFIWKQMKRAKEFLKEPTWRLVLSPYPI